MQRKGEFANVIITAEETGTNLRKLETAFYWLHGAVNGYFNGIAEIYAAIPPRARHSLESVNTYLPSSFESLVKNVFIIERTRYFQEAIKAAASRITNVTPLEVVR